MKEIQLSHGGPLLRFPDSMSDDQIHAAIQQHYPKENYSNKENGVLSNAANYARDISIGGAKMGHHALRALRLPHKEDAQIERFFGQKQSPTLSHSILQSLSQYAPSIPIAMAGGPVGAQIIGQGLFGMTQNENPRAGLAEGAASALAGPLLGRAINALRPSRLINSPLSKDELLRSMEVTHGTPTDLGNVINNPRLQRLYENKLPSYSGEPHHVMQQAASNITQRGEDILSNLLGKHSPEDVPAKLNDVLTKAFKEHQNLKNSLYKQANDIANKQKIKLDLPEFASRAKKHISAIEESTILQHEPDAKMILNKLMNYANPVKETIKKGLLVDEHGNPLLEEVTHTRPTLKEANLLKGKLSNYASQYAKSPDPSQRGLSKIFSELSSSLRGDINKSIESHANPELTSAYEAAEKNYKNNFSRFLDRDVYKFASGQGDPDTLVQKFIRTSRASDLGNQLGKLQHTLPEKQLLGYTYLSRSLDNEGNLNPQKLATAIHSLGKKQFKTLFPDIKIQRELLNYKSLVQKNKEALNTMFNPKTGQRNASVFAHGAASGVGAALGAAFHGSPGAAIGALLGPAITSQGAKTLTKLLTSEKIRNNLIKAMINDKDIKLGTAAKNSLPLVTESAINQ